MVNKKRLIGNDVANKLQEYAAKISDYDTMFNFQNKFKNLIDEYNNS